MTGAARRRGGGTDPETAAKGPNRAGAEPHPIRHRDRRRAEEVLRGTGAAADVVVWEHSPFERRARVVCSLPATVLGEGRLVHAA